ncbi:hypothetical protein [Streptomyces indicus]|uniref:hypothetical protein n=1 Tax=Streptomyces indicus TaxID=417292 RepID=UPI000B847968|nr:hypothetical protein [Streptomyces indicus]
MLLMLSVLLVVVAAARPGPATLLASRPGHPGPAASRPGRAGSVAAAACSVAAPGRCVLTAARFLVTVFVAGGAPTVPAARVPPLVGVAARPIAAELAHAGASMAIRSAAIPREP